jgi:hypothetical protein
LLGGRAQLYGYPGSPYELASQVVIHIFFDSLPAARTLAITVN